MLHSARELLRGTRTVDGGQEHVHVVREHAHGAAISDARKFRCKQIWIAAKIGVPEHRPRTHGRQPRTDRTADVAAPVRDIRNH